MATPARAALGRARSRGASLLRFARVVAGRPGEAVERVRIKVEVVRERRLWPVPHPYREDVDWERRLHELVGAPYPCPASSGFDDLHGRIGSLLGSDRPATGPAHDPDVAVARATWCLVRHLRPVTVVETGVARGVTTRVILEALESNQAGHLWSVDLPPVSEPWARQVGAAVPASLHGRWTYQRGSSRRLLPALFRDLGQLDLFVHDSLHTHKNLAFELHAGWDALRAGGALLADDVGWNTAFRDFAPAGAAGQPLVARQEHKGGFFGIVVKGEQVWPASGQPDDGAEAGERAQS